MAQSNFWKESGIGQLFMTGIPGTELDDDTVSLIRDYAISKFILFSKNAQRGPKALKNLCQDIKRVCFDHGLKPLLAVDQEGGPVRRLKPPDFSDMPSQNDIRKDKEPERAMIALASTTVSLLRTFSIDINFAPVLDLCLHGEKNVLKGRCFGTEPEKVARLGEIYIDHLEKHCIRTTAKHFPGIGRVELDPHHQLPTVKSDKDTIFYEALPFRSAIGAGVSCIMTSHVIFQGLDPQKPATFSYQIATELLRNVFGFSGVLITDDLEMRGALTTLNIAQAALSALMAGHDLLLVCNSPEKLNHALLGLKKAWEKGILPPQRVHEACERLSRL